MTEITRGQFAIAAVVVAVLAFAGSRALRPEPQPTGAQTSGGGGGPAVVDRGGARSPVAIARPPARRIVVHVAGAVRRPGVYRLRDGQRLADAIERAGGGTRRADLDAINLAAKARDGVQVLVPRRAPGGGTVPGGGGVAGGVAAAVPGAAAGGAPAAAGAIVDLNTATAEQLETLDGVGPATSAKILQYRATNGPFRSVDDLEQIPGIGPKKLAAIRPRARV